MCIAFCAWMTSGDASPLDFASTMPLTVLTPSNHLNFLNGLYERARHAQDDRSNTLVRAACVLLEQNLEQRISMGEFARRLEVSHPTLRRVFRRNMGLSPGEYRIRRRIERSCTLLMSYSVKEVAARLGYNDAFTFSAQFKTVMKTSPRDFRQSLTRHGTNLPADFPLQ
jgi:AraC-like DNA-binding protein